MSVDNMITCISFYDLPAEVYATTSNWWVRHNFVQRIYNINEYLIYK